MVSTDTKMYNVNKLKSALNQSGKTLSQGVKVAPIVKVTSTIPAGKTLYSSKPKITIAKPLEIVKASQTAKKKNEAIKSTPKGIDQIVGGVAGVILGQALQNPLLSPETNKKILIQSTEQGLSGGIDKVAAVVPAGLGGTVGYAISGKEGIAPGIQQGAVNTITNTINKEYVEKITTTVETVKEGADMLKGAGEFLNKYGVWIAVGVGAILLFPMIRDVFKK